MRGSTRELLLTVVLCCAGGTVYAQEDVPAPTEKLPTQAESRPLSVEPKVLDDKLLGTIEGSTPAGGALLLERVLGSVDRYHPKISSAQAKQGSLEAKAFAHEGAFDPLLSGKAWALRGGYYETTTADVEIRQYLGLWGSEVYGGYRLGVAQQDDRYPAYEKTETLQDGELRVGLSVPIWRDGATDRRRTAIAVADDLARAGGFNFIDTKLSVRLGAVAAYYDWLAAGHLLDIADRLLELAQTRRRQVVAQRDAGSASDFEVADSEQMVFARQDAVALAKQKLRGAAVELSLYNRDDEGRALIPERGKLPPFDGAPKVRALSADRIANCHPQYRALRARIDAAQEHLQLAENQVAPEANATFEVSRDLGRSDGNPDLVGTNFNLGVQFKVPLFLRQGRGRAEAAQFELDSMMLESQWLQDKMRALSQKVLVNQRAARRRSEVARELVGATEMLAEGERYRLNAGGSTMFVVNLREMAVAQAATKLIYSLAELHTMAATITELNALSCEG